MPSAVGGLIPRRLLFDRLSAAAAGGVTLLSAPPGSGKTMLLRSWIEDAGLGERVAWVPVERRERDAQRFWRTVIGTLTGAVGGAEARRGAGLRRRGRRRRGRDLVGRLRGDARCVSDARVLLERRERGA